MRVSPTDEQNNALQSKALKAAGYRRLFERQHQGGDGIGRVAPRARSAPQKRHSRTWKLDRLSHSLKDVLHIWTDAQAGAGFRSVTENIDTITPAGRMMMQMVGSFAEFERAMIRERTSAGIAVVRAEGRIGGGRRKLDATKRREIAENVITERKCGAA